MDLNLNQLIAALASPPGGSLRGIIRISGEGVRDLLGDWFEPVDGLSWTSAQSASAHSGSLRLISDPSLAVPTQVMLWPNRRSYTGQPLAELHLPGSPCLLEQILVEAYRRGARPARPGEFTMRAFLAGKLDLMQAEAVLGVIDARDHVELETALAQLAGGISGKLGMLRRGLLELLADLEAGLDFVDEDIEFVSRHEVVERLQAALTMVDALVNQTDDRMQSHVRPKVVLAGLPNAGKSTLFNCLSGTGSALVSPEKGTTRDFLTRAVTWEDLSFDLVDTAGWEDTSTGIAAAAQDQRVAQLNRSDLLVWCSAAKLDESDRKFDNNLFEQAIKQWPTTVRLMTKIDLAEDVSGEPTSTSMSLSPKDRLAYISVSATTGAGLAKVRDLFRSRLNSDRARGSQWLGMTAARCRDTLVSISTALEGAHRAACVAQTGDELIAVDLREALDHLGAVLGVLYTDDILDRIFSKFCIGK